MKQFLAFSKKEWMDYVRTYKLLIVIILFAVFGFMNPIAAKILPELLESFMPEGIEIAIPKPVVMDAWLQFYKNIGTILFVFVVIASGSIANEIQKGTLIIGLTKGLSRKTVILSKFSMMSVLWTIGYLLYFVLTAIYTVVLFSEGNPPFTLLGASLVWLFGLMMIALTLFFGTMFKTLIGALLATGGVALLMMLLEIIPNAYAWCPSGLLSKSVELLTQTLSPIDFIGSLLVCIACTTLAIAGAITIFNKSKV